jgi:DNA-binding response OmpR family regulator
MTSILVIEDSKALRLFVGHSLSEAGYTVMSAQDGSEGVRLWQERQPELVITDIMMPERDGIETIQVIRRQNPHAKILAMTGFCRSGSIDFPDMLRCLGADDVLTKPFLPKALLAKVDAVLKRPPFAAA